MENIIMQSSRAVPWSCRIYEKQFVQILGFHRRLHTWKYVKLSAVNTCMILSMHVKTIIMQFWQISLNNWENTKTEATCSDSGMHKK